MTDAHIFDTIARYYDLLYDQRDDDLDMWLALTEKITGNILEIGCGTGRVMIPLLQAGRQVTGVDISQEALQVAEAKLVAGGFQNQGTLYQVDMRSMDLECKDFEFAFLPINTFMHCQTTDDQIVTLQSIYHHLTSGGTLVIDLFHPTPQRLLEADGQLVLEHQMVDELTGHVIQWFVTRRLHITHQVEDVTFILDEVQENGILSRALIPFSLRYIYRFEMALLLKNVGFQLDEIWGDYDFSSYCDESPRMIFVVTKLS